MSDANIVWMIEMIAKTGAFSIIWAKSVRER